ncbi:MAG: B12-binding domain-containing radical SAM protein, partial [Proteobacteria bacterium]|nr:B12-binding domain-containing radical SAM protein [Pseudomonadota bacterium]
MKVLLISPPREKPVFADFPPMGLAYLAGVLRKNGINVKIIDAASYPWNILEKCIRSYDFDIAGVTCWTIERKQTFLTAKLIRECRPDAKIVIGGQHATALPEHMFTLAEADVVVLGEGEETFLELVQALRDGVPLSSVNGIVYKENGKFYKTNPRSLIGNLDDLPFPVYEDFDFTLYHGLPEVNEPCAALITSRGCPYRCIFCSSTVFWGKKWRMRSAENILEEMKYLNQKFGLRAFFFFDDTFIANKERVVKLCQMIIEDNFEIKWACCGRVNQVDEEILCWMKKAGCYRIDYGVESGSPRILRNIKKGITVNDIKKAFKLSHQAEILPRAYLMMGNPGECEESVNETIGLMKEIKPYNSADAQLLWVLPNTELYESMKVKGLISDRFWVENTKTCFYTAEHSMEELQRLRNNLRNKLTLKSSDYYEPKFPILLEAGRLFLSEDLEKEAFWIFDKIVELDPECIEVHYYLGSYFEEEGDFCKAEKEF